MNREKIYINGYEYWIAKEHGTVMFYDSETAKNGISIEDVKWTKDELRQIREYVKYRHPELCDIYYNLFFI